MINDPLPFHTWPDSTPTFACITVRKLAYYRSAKTLVQHSGELNRSTFALKGVYHAVYNTHASSDWEPSNATASVPQSHFLRRVSRLEDYINIRRRGLQENWQSQSTKCAVQLLEHCSSTFYIPFIVLCLTWWLTCTPLAQAIDSPKANCKMCYVMNFTHRASCVTSPALRYKTEYGRAFILLLTINT